MLLLDNKITALETLKPLTTRSFTKSSLTVSTWEHSMSLSHSFLQIKAENQNFPQTQFTIVVLSLCWQMPKLTVWHFWTAFFNEHFTLQPSIEKRRTQSCTPNNLLTPKRFLPFHPSARKVQPSYQLQLSITASRVAPTWRSERRVSLLPENFTREEAIILSLSLFKKQRTAFPRQMLVRIV